MEKNFFERNILNTLKMSWKICEKFDIKQLKNEFL